MYNFIHIPKNAGTSIKKYCQKQKNLIYRNHRFTSQDLENTICILREPKDRWISSINYLIKFYKNKGSIIDEQKINFDYVASKMLKDRKDPEIFDLIKAQHDQTVGDRKLILNWVIQPQREWFYKPKNIILFNNLNYEWKFICNQLAIGDGVIGNFNESKKSKPFFSIESNKFINEFYKEDFIIWNYWSKLPIEERINIDWSKHENFSNRL